MLRPLDPSSPLGLHRVLEPARRRCRRRRSRLDAARRRSGRTRCGSTSRRSTSTRRPTASSPRSTHGDGDARPGRGARHRRDPRQDAEPGHRLRRHARRHRRGGRPGEPARSGGGGPGGHARVAVADAAGHHRRAGAVGRSQRAGPGPGPRDPLRPVHRRRPARTTSTRGSRSWSWTSAARRPSSRAWSVREDRRGDRSSPRPTVCVLGGAGKSGLALPGRRPRRRRRPPHRRRPPSRREADHAARIGSGRRGRRRRRPLARSASPRRSRAAGGPADVTVVCVDVPGCEQPAILATARRRHRRLLLDGHRASPPPPWAPRGWPPT